PATATAPECRRIRAARPGRTHHRLRQATAPPRRRPSTGALPEAPASATPAASDVVPPDRHCATSCHRPALPRCPAAGSQKGGRTTARTARKSWFSFDRQIDSILNHFMVHVMRAVANVLPITLDFSANLESLKNQIDSFSVRIQAIFNAAEQIFE